MSKRNDIFRKSDLSSGFVRQLIISVAVAAIIISFMLFFSDAIRRYFAEKKDHESRIITNTYMQDIRTLREASSIINTMLDNRIAAAGALLASEDIASMDNRKVAALAENTGVDDIFLYNSRGELVLSGNGRFIGWKAYVGHPVYEFMTCNAESLIEDIRLDTKSGEYYKYGYRRLNNGYFVQIGILADKIYAFLDSFDVQNLIDRILDEQDVLGACLLDGDLNRIASCGYAYVEDGTLLSSMSGAIAGGEPFSRTVEREGRPVLQIGMPVPLSEDEVGILLIGYDLTDTQSLITLLNTLNILVFTVILALFFILSIGGYQKNRMLYRNAYFEPLTGLPNRALLEIHAGMECKKTAEERGMLLLISFTGFKLIEATFGYPYASQCIKEIVKKLRAAESESFRMFQLSVDRFVYYAGSCKRDDLTEKGCGEILGILREADPMNRAGAAIGIVDISRYEGDVETLIKYASAAADHVDRNTLPAYGFFTAEIDASMNRSNAIETELRRVIAKDPEAGAIVLEYQPIVDLKNGRIAGFEALARLESRGMGLIRPAEFVEIAEKHSLIYDIGDRITRQACDFAEKLCALGFTGLTVTVNVSVLQLMREEFTADFFGMIAERHISPANIAIEVTESVFFDNYDHINRKLSDIRGMGVQIAIDDFGTGYSSLARESELNTDFLKIDKYFIDKLMVQDPLQGITGDIISMAHKPGHRVIAEGVEFEKQKQYLIENRCDFMQGFLFSRPVSSEKAISMLYGQAG